MLRQSVSRSWELFLRDMLEAARKVIRFTADELLGPIEREAAMT